MNFAWALCSVSFVGDFAAGELVCVFCWPACGWLHGVGEHVVHLLVSKPTVSASVM